MINKELAEAIKLVYQEYNNYVELEIEQESAKRDILSFSCWCEMNFNRAQAFDEWLETKSNKE